MTVWSFPSSMRTRIAWIYTGERSRMEGIIIFICRGRDEGFLTIRRLKEANPSS